MEIFSGYNSIIGTSENFKSSFYDDKLYFKFGMNEYEEFSERFLIELFKILKIKVNFKLFNKMDKEVVSNLINESLICSEKFTFFCLSIYDKLDRILINPTFSSDVGKIPKPINEVIKENTDANLLFTVNYIDGKLILIDIGIYDDIKYRKVLGFFIRDIYSPFFYEKNSIYMIEFIAENIDDSLILYPSSESLKSYVFQNGFDKAARVFSEKILVGSTKINSVLNLIRKCHSFVRNSLLQI
jgi:hypothetical protein